MEEKEKTVVEIGESVYVFYHTPFEAQVDMDDLTAIHYDNLLGDIITIPTLMNRVGILKADADNEVRTLKLYLNILEAKKSDYHRKKLTTDDGTKIKYPTVSQVENGVTQDQEVIDSKMKYYDACKQADIIDSLYWSVKSKEMKLNKVSEGITPTDFEKEILEGTVNGVLIKKMQKSF